MTWYQVDTWYNVGFNKAFKFRMVLRVMQAIIMWYSQSASQQQQSSIIMQGSSSNINDSSNCSYSSRRVRRLGCKESCLMGLAVGCRKTAC